MPPTGRMTAALSWFVTECRQADPLISNRGSRVITSLSLPRCTGWADSGTGDTIIQYSIITQAFQLLTLHIWFVLQCLLTGQLISTITSATSRDWRLPLHSTTASDVVGRPSIQPARNNMSSDIQLHLASCKHTAMKNLTSPTPFPRNPTILLESMTIMDPAPCMDCSMAIAETKAWKTEAAFKPKLDVVRRETA